MAKKAKTSARSKGYRKTVQKKPFLTKKEIIALVAIVAAIALAVILFNLLYDDGSLDVVDGVVQTENLENSLIATDVAGGETKYFKVGEVGEIAQDLLNYIMSAEGQAIINEEGYIAIDDAAEAYTAAGVSGEITVGGSSSVTPVMEKLAEAYMALNPDVTVVVQQSDSTTGVTGTIEGTVDLGMASRALKAEEEEQGVVGTTIAMDGIAVIVNLENDTENLTTEQIMNIYTGAITDWSELAA